MEGEKEMDIVAIVFVIAFLVLGTISKDDATTKPTQQQETEVDHEHSNI